MNEPGRPGVAPLNSIVEASGCQFSACHAGWKGRGRRAGARKHSSRRILETEKALRNVAELLGRANPGRRPGSSALVHGRELAVRRDDPRTDHPFPKFGG